MDMETVISNAVNDSQDIAPVDTTPSVDASDTDVSSDTSTQTGTAPDSLADEPDAFAKEHGYRSKRADGRENRIPHSRVQKIAQNQTRKALSSIAKELGLTNAEAEDLGLDHVMGALTERGTKFKAHEERLSNIDAIEEIMANDEDRFISMMAEHNPRYKKFADFLANGAAAPRQSTQVDEKNDLKPEPDYPIKDAQGNVVGMTYSLKGLDALQDWRERKMERQIQAKMDERFKPVDEAAKRQKDESDRQARFEVITRQAEERIDKTLARAQKWPLWKENEADILKAYQGGAEDVFEAYISTVITKMQGDRTKMREDILGEMKKAPKDTSTTVQNTAPTGGAARSIEDVMRDQLRRDGLIK